MLSKTFTLESETGLHARPATELAKIAMKYPCDIKLIANGKTVMQNLHYWLIYCCISYNW